MVPEKYRQGLALAIETVSDIYSGNSLPWPVTPGFRGFAQTFRTHYYKVGREIAGPHAS